MKKIYSLGDYPNYEERKHFGFKIMENINLPSKSIKSVYTGEQRCPKKGEWFLSGSTVQAYRASSDMSTAYHIAKLVLVKTKTVVTEEIIG